jgi:hypothetical protein
MQRRANPSRAEAPTLAAVQHFAFPRPQISPIFAWARHGGRTEARATLPCVDFAQGPGEKSPNFQETGSAGLANTEEFSVTFSWSQHLLLGALLLSSAPALAENYQTTINPTPLATTNRQNVVGLGTVQATLTGNKLSLHGAFAGLATPATDAHLCLSFVMGGPGASFQDLQVTQTTKGEIHGDVTLTPEQVQGLKDGKMYVLLNSQKAPKGNLWGWFEPAHKTVGDDVPEEGHWYIPSILKDEHPPKPGGLS